MKLLVPLSTFSKCPPLLPLQLKKTKTKKLTLLTMELAFLFKLDAPLDFTCISSKPCYFMLSHLEYSFFWNTNYLAINYLAIICQAQS